METLAPLRRGFFVRRVSGRNENPSRVVLQPDVGHGLFQGRREPNARWHPEVQARIDLVYQEHLAKLGKRRRDRAAPDD